MVPEGLVNVSPQPEDKEESMLVMLLSPSPPSLYISIERENIMELQFGPLLSLNVLITLTLQGRTIRRFKAVVADRRIGGKSNVHGSLSGLKSGRNLHTTISSQQRRTRHGAIPHLKEEQCHETSVKCYMLIWSRQTAGRSSCW